jgi:hypothetical protein
MLANSVSEEIFSTLKYKSRTGYIGPYQVALKSNNGPEKWSAAFAILKNAGATLRSQYQGTGYQFSYWIYGCDKIYRTKVQNDPSSTEEKQSIGENA